MKRVLYCKFCKAKMLEVAQVVRYIKGREVILARIFECPKCKARCIVRPLRKVK